MPGGVWKTVEADTEKIRVAETEGGGGKGGSRKKMRKERGKEEAKKVEVKKIVEEQEIWDKEEEMAKLEAEAKKLVPEKFHKQIKVFGKKQLERISARKIWDYAIDMKERFVLRKEKVYLLSREKREEVQEFIKEQLRKGYIRPSKLPQMVPVFFVGKNDGKKRMVQDY